MKHYRIYSWSRYPVSVFADGYRTTFLGTLVFWKRDKLWDLIPYRKTIMTIDTQKEFSGGYYVSEVP